MEQIRPNHRIHHFLSRRRRTRERLRLERMVCQKVGDFDCL
jgi:hypothetical protein